jgi:membrane fusion protein (multidrug efflux system)
MSTTTVERTSEVGAPQSPPAEPQSPAGNGHGAVAAPPAPEARAPQPAAPAGESATGAASRPASPGRKPLILAVVGLAALSVVGLGVRQWMFGLSHVTTDNAQVDGHIVPLLPKVSGFVAAVNVEDNQTVKAGDLLVLLDDRDFAARMKQSDADLAVALANAGSRSRTGQAAAQLAAARATVAQAEANAWRAAQDLERYRVLAAREVIGRQQLDAAEAAAKSTDAQLQAAREQVSAAEAALQGADARVAAARALRDQAALQLSYTRITAPASGVVSRKSVEVGQLVQSGQPLMSLVPLDDVWVVANLKETEIKEVTPGDRVEIEADSYPGRRFPGRVESLSPATGAKFSLLPPDNATGNFTKVVQRIPVRVRLVGPPDAAHPLRPGTSVKVVIATR